MNMKTKTTTTDTLSEDRRCVQGIKYNDGGGSRSTTCLVDCKRQRSVDVTCFKVANINAVSSLSSCCLVLIVFFIRLLFWGSLHEILLVLQSYRKYFCTKCTLTLRMYPPTYRR